MDLNHTLRTLDDIAEYTGSTPDTLNLLIVRGLEGVLGGRTSEYPIEFPLIVEAFVLQPRKVRAFYGEVELTNSQEIVTLCNMMQQSLIALMTVMTAGDLLGAVQYPDITLRDLERRTALENVESA